MQDKRLEETKKFYIDTIKANLLTAKKFIAIINSALRNSPEYFYHGGLFLEQMDKKYKKERKFSELKNKLQYRK